MKFLEAMRIFQEGKKVRSKLWKPGIVLELKPSLYFLMDYEDIQAEWEILEEPKLSFAEMVKGLREGKKYKRSKWLATLPIETLGSQHICNDIGKVHLKLEDFEATDWIEVHD